MVRVITPSAQRRPRPRVASIRSGRRISRKARKRRPVTASTARAVATPLSRKAVVISSLDSAGEPVTPTRTDGNSGRRPAMIRRSSPIFSWLSVNEPSRRVCSTNMKSSRSSGAAK